MARAKFPRLAVSSYVILKASNGGLPLPLNSRNFSVSQSHKLWDNSHTTTTFSRRLTLGLISLCLSRRLFLKKWHWSAAGHCVLASNTHLGSMTWFYRCDNLLVSQSGEPTLTNTWVCSSQLLLYPAGLMTVFLLAQIRESCNLDNQDLVFMSPRNKVVQLYPLAQGFIFIASYKSQGCGGSIGTVPAWRTDWNLSSRIKYILRPTICRPVLLGAAHPFGFLDYILPFPIIYQTFALFLIRGPLWREDGSELPFYLWTRISQNKGPHCLLSSEVLVLTRATRYKFQKTSIINTAVKASCSSFLRHSDHIENIVSLVHKRLISYQWSLFTVYEPGMAPYSSLHSCYCIVPGSYIVIIKDHCQKQMGNNKFMNLSKTKQIWSIYLLMANHNLGSCYWSAFLCRATWMPHVVNPQCISNMASETKPLGRSPSYFDKEPFQYRLLTISIISYIPCYRS
jgi:hypothetical protein